jgi:hypothetical protein
MNCFDCATIGRSQAAVGMCISCGSGVCAECVRTEQSRVDQHATVGNPATETTRKLLCPSCDRVLSGRVLAPVG